MRVLLTNNTLASRAGSELYVRDIAIGLLRRGHQPVAYSRDLGAVADELRAATVPVLDDLSRLAQPPDVIHGHHHLETLTALLHFPGVPALSFCHGWVPWEEAPVHFPRVHRYVAVDELCRERLISREGIAPHRIALIRNFADQRRFLPRSPLPDRPRRALAVGNEFGEHNGLAILRAACAAHGVELHAVGHTQGNSQPLEQLLPLYDLIFARARTAIEAMTVGCAVVNCAWFGHGPLITTANAAALQRWNFGVRVLQQPLTVASLSAEIARYDAADAAAVSAHIRRTANLEDALDQLIVLYQEAAHHPPAASPEQERAAAARYLWEWTPLFKGGLARTGQLLEHLPEQLLTAEQAALLRDRAAAAAAVAEWQHRATQLRAELEAVQRSHTWRWSQAVLQHPLLRRFAQRLARRASAQ